MRFCLHISAVSYRDFGIKLSRPRTALTSTEAVGNFIVEGSQDGGKIPRSEEGKRIYVISVTANDTRVRRFYLPLTAIREIARQKRRVAGRVACSLTIVRDREYHSGLLRVTRDEKCFANPARKMSRPGQVWARRSRDN